MRADALAPSLHLSFSFSLSRILNSAKEEIERNRESRGGTVVVDGRKKKKTKTSSSWTTSPPPKQTDSPKRRPSFLSQHKVSLPVVLLPDLGQDPGAVGSRGRAVG